MRVRTFSAILATLPATAFAGTPENLSAIVSTTPPVCTRQNCNASISGQSVVIGNNAQIVQTGRVDGPQITIARPSPLPARE